MLNFELQISINFGNLKKIKVCSLQSKIRRNCWCAGSSKKNKVVQKWCYLIANLLSLVRIFLWNVYTVKRTKLFISLLNVIFWPILKIIRIAHLNLTIFYLYLENFYEMYEFWTELKLFWFYINVEHHFYFNLKIILMLEIEMPCTINK